MLSGLSVTRSQMNGGTLTLQAIILALALACGVQGADDFPFTDCTAMPAGLDAAKAKDPGGTEGLDAVKGDGRTVKVTLRGTYKGFRIHAVMAGDKMAKGKFMAGDDYKNDVKMLTCDGMEGGGIAHKDSSKDLSNIAVTWTADDSFEGTVKFMAMIVKSKDDFTKTISSSEVEIPKADGPPGPPAPQPDGPATHAPPSGETTPSRASGLFDGLFQFLIGIGISLGCVVLGARHQRWMFI